MKKQVIIYFITTLVLILFSTPVLAVPALLSHQGNLENSNSQPLVGTANIIFSLYTQETEGTPVWSEQLAVTFDSGHYSVILGESETLDESIIDGGSLYLGVQLEGNGEFLPRTVVTSVPYSFRAITAEQVVTPNGETVVDSDGNWTGADISNIDESILETYLSDNGYVQDTTLDDYVTETELTEGVVTEALLTTSGSIDDLEVTNSAFMDSDLDVVYNLTVGGNTVLEADFEAAGTLWVQGDAAFDSNLETGQDLIVGGDSLVVGSMELGGVVKLGDDDTCDSSTAGTIRWSGTSFLGCNGTDWIDLDSSSTASIRTIQRKVGYGNDGRDSGYLDGRVLSFTKTRDDTDIRISWSDNRRTLAYSYGYWEIYLNGQHCTVPGRMRSYRHTRGIDNGSYSDYHLSSTHIHYCNTTAAGPLTAGTYEIKIQVHHVGGGRSDWYVGWDNTQYVLEAEEVF